MGFYRHNSGCKRPQEVTGGLIQSSVLLLLVRARVTSLGRALHYKAQNSSEGRISDSEKLHWRAVQAHNRCNYGFLLLLLQNMLRQQQKVFQQARIVQSQRLKTIKQLYEQFLKVNILLGRHLILIVSLKKAVLVQCFKLFGISLTK